MKKKGILSFAVVFLFCMICSVSVYAAGVYEEPGSTMASHNWANPVKCHTISNEDGSITIIYSIWNGSKQKLFIDAFSSSGEKLSHKSITVPGKTWGGTVYQGPDGCYYIATGNSDDVAFYISKYNANWELLGRTSIGKDESYTSEAYDAGNSDMTMVGDYLIVHAARGRQDGHQSNTTFYINKNTMKAVYVPGNFSFSHVSHSFSQFVRNIDDQVMLVDQGDAYPRSVLLQTYQLTETEEGLENQNLKELPLLEIKGGTGVNYTGVTVDGFELGSSNHIVVGTSIPHDQFSSDSDFENYEGGNNVFVSVINKNLQSSTFKWLTSYKDVEVKNLELIKVNDDRFFLLYGIEDESENDKTCYMIIDSKGNIQKSGSMDKRFYCTSEPSVKGNTITWCHYVESDLGHFLVMNRWNTAKDVFRVYNLDIGVKSNISKISGSTSYIFEEKKEANLVQAVYSDVFKENYPTAPAVWKSSNPDVLEILEEETILSRAVYNRSYKDVSTRVKVKKSGTVTVACRVGNKTSKIKVKVQIKETLPKTAITKLKKASSTSMKVYWKKKSGISGYQICYSTSKTFKNAKKVYVKDAAVTAKKISKLTKKKTYYVKIRTYKNTKIDGKRVNLYSGWSGKEKVKL